MAISFAEFKTKLRCQKDTKKMRGTASEDNVMKARVQVSKQKVRPWCPLNVDDKDTMWESVNISSGAVCAKAACNVVGKRKQRFRWQGLHKVDNDMDIQPGRIIKETGLMVDIITDVRKFKAFWRQFPGRDTLRGIGWRHKMQQSSRTKGGWGGVPSRQQQTTAQCDAECKNVPCDHGSLQLWCYSKIARVEDGMLIKG